MGKDKIDIERLLIEVQNRALLYNCQHPSYQDAEKMGNLWTAIGTVLGASGEQVYRSIYIDGARRSIKNRGLSQKTARKTACQLP